MGSAASIEKIVEKGKTNIGNNADQMPKLGKNDAVDIFAREMYMSSPKIDALQHVLSSAAGRYAFMTFLCTEFAEENLTFFIAVDTLKKLGDSVDLANQANSIIATYMQPGLPTEVNLSDCLKNAIVSMVKGEVVATKKEILDAFEAAQHETVRIMAMGAFPRFVLSSGFIKYRTLDHIADPEIQARMSKELDELLHCTSWLSHLLSSVENLPVCISLAAANKELSGFPLIYVNGAFEKTTGYPREEIIGQNCRFLQMGKLPGHTSEGESIARMSIALKEGRQVKVAITNFKKDGTPFRNLLAMKPIFDQKGKYAFVLGIQFDIGDGEASPKKMRIIDDLFRVLPNTITSVPQPIVLLQESDPI